MSDDIIGLSSDQKIVREAHKRFERAQSWEGTARDKWIEDVKYHYADDENGWQWPANMRDVRQRTQRPCLTINKTRQHNLQIINDARQNKVAVKISPVGGGATKEAADVFEGIIRHIEYRSNAQSAYDEASKYQVVGGLGFWRILTEYEADGFDQEIRIERIADPMSVYIDPDCREADCSDARFAFVFADRPRDEVEVEYPQFKGRSPQNAVDNGSSWLTDDHIRECEYYRVKETDDKLLLLEDGSSKLASEIPQPLRRVAIEKAQKTRDLVSRKVEWFKIVGDEVVDRGEWAGKYIPVVQVIGEEVVIDGQLDRRGHTRALRDPQRMYNYASSAAVEFVGQQSKAPYLAPAAAIEGYEEMWGSANTVSHSVLPWNHMADGQPIPPPIAQNPPQPSSAALQMMQTSAEEMMMVSGQYQAEMGAPGNEKSGIAIQQRQRQGDTATYHYIDNLARAIRFTGKILIDLIPKIYDTERVVRILAEDGTETAVQIDPSHPAAHTPTQGEAAAIFNPSVGRYEVQADVGPEFATRRQETFNALTQLMAGNPALMERVGDLLMKAADFPMAEEIAERLAPGLVPAQQMQAMQAQAQKSLGDLQKKLSDTVEALAEAQIRLKRHESKNAVEIYRAETDRMTALHDAWVDQHGVAQGAVKQVMDATRQDTLSEADAADDAGLKQAAAS